MFSKATKIDEIFTVDLTLCNKCQIDSEDFVNFCCLLRKHKIYLGENDVLKLMFSKKAKKFDKIFTVNLTLCSKCQVDGEDFIHFCGLLGKYEL